MFLLVLPRRLNFFSDGSVYFGCVFSNVFQCGENLPDVLWVWLNAPWIFADTIRRFPKVYWMLDVCWRFPHVLGVFWTLRYASAIVLDFFEVWWVLLAEAEALARSAGNEVKPTEA